MTITLSVAPTVLVAITVVTVGVPAIMERNDSGWMAGLMTALAILANVFLWVGYGLARLLL